MKKRYILKNKRRFSAFVAILLLIAFTTIFATAAYGYKEPRYETVTVKPGDTLWAISKQYSGDMDIREIIYRIKKINRLAESGVYPGEELKIPVQ